MNKYDNNVKTCQLLDHNLKKTANCFYQIENNCLVAFYYNGNKKCDYFFNLNDLSLVQRTIKYVIYEAVQHKDKLMFQFKTRDFDELTKTDNGEDCIEISWSSSQGCLMYQLQPSQLDYSNLIKVNMNMDNDDQ